MDKQDIECYRTNYSKGWIHKSKDGWDIPSFPCVGAVEAIHALCDEVERLHHLLDEMDEYKDQGK